MNNNEVQLGMTNREASLLRAALHIACALTAKAHPHSRPELSAEFAKLHGEFRDSGVENFDRDTVLTFEADILDAVHNSDSDARLLRDLFAPPTFARGYGGLNGGPFDLIVHRPSGGKSALAQRLAIEHMRTLPPVFIADLDFAKLEQRVGACLTQPPPAELLRTKLPDVIADDQSARHIGLTASQTGLVNASARSKWVVQFLREYSTPHGWVWSGSDGERGAACGVYASRNEAYRQMRQRMKRTGFNESSYRVVPVGTADGPEKDRGFYTVEFFAKFGTVKGWYTSFVQGLSGTFPTASGAQAAIDDHIGEASRRRYRVKWHRTRAK